MNPEPPDTEPESHAPDGPARKPAWSRRIGIVGLALTVGGLGTCGAGMPSQSTLDLFTWGTAITALGLFVILLAALVAFVEWIWNRKPL
jgi:hypothetical protein